LKLELNRDYLDKMSEPRFKFDKNDFRNEEPSPEHYERMKAEEIYLEKIKPEFEKQEKFLAFYNHARKNNIRFDNLFEDIEIKRNALESIMGYKSLKGARSIKSASDQTVSKVYRKLYHNAEEHLDN
tara:strand:- start:412 stop:792 length:381 start_codon:yes stop_codon:yes gene_type:complete